MVSGDNQFIPLSGAG